MAIDMFAIRTMLGMVEEGRKSNNTFLRDRYFTYRPTFQSETVDIDIVGIGNRKLAPFVHPRTGGVGIDREGYRTNSYKAPMLAPYRVTTAEDALKRLPGENIYSTKSPQTRVAELLAKDLGDLDEIISRTEEAMCAEALFTGKVTIKGEGVDDVLNYWTDGEAAKPETTLATKWDASAVDASAILKDVRDIRRTQIKRAGITPTEMICGTGVVDVLVDKLSKAGQLDNRRVDLGQIDPKHLPNGVTYWGYLKDSAMDIYSYDAWYVNADDEEVPFVPNNKILFATPSAKTMLAYGLVALTTTQGVQFFEGARVPYSWTQELNPAGRIVRLTSRPLPVINQIHGFHVVNALA